MFGLAKYDREVKFISLLLILTYLLSPILVKLTSPLLSLLPNPYRDVTTNAFTAWMPAFVGITLTFINIGWEGLKQLLKKLVPQLRHVVLYISFPLLALAIVAVAIVLVDLDIGLMWRHFYHNWPIFMVLLLMQLCFVAIGEELGWRGYLQSGLLRKCSRHKAAIFIFLAWALWHWPKFMLLSFTGSLALSLSLLAFSFFFVYSRSWFRPYLLLFAIIHGSFNTSIYFFESIYGDSIVKVWLAVSLIYALLALIAVFCETILTSQSNEGPTHYSGY